MTTHPKVKVVVSTHLFLEYRAYVRRENKTAEKVRLKLLKTKGGIPVMTICEMILRYPGIRTTRVHLLVVHFHLR